MTHPGVQPDRININNPANCPQWTQHSSWATSSCLRRLRLQATTPATSKGMPKVHAAPNACGNAVPRKCTDLTSPSVDASRWLT